MNNPFEQEIRYKVLKLLSAQPNLSQRALAGKLGISLGKTNYVLTELAEKGIIKLLPTKTLEKFTFFASHEITASS